MMSSTEIHKLLGGLAELRGSMQIVFKNEKEDFAANRVPATFKVTERGMLINAELKSLGLTATARARPVLVDGVWLMQYDFKAPGLDSGDQVQVYRFHITADGRFVDGESEFGTNDSLNNMFNQLGENLSSAVLTSSLYAE